LAEELRAAVDRCWRDVGFELFGDVRIDLFRVELCCTRVAEAFAHAFEM